jgi:LacI family transcriptional regulator
MRPKRLQKEKMARRPSMNDVARLAGVCKATVSLALRGSRQIPVKTRDRVQRAAQKLGYAQNPVVAHLLSELRRDHRMPRRHTLALFNAHGRRDAFTANDTIPTWVQGCRRRAEVLGYGTDDFWLHDPGCPPRRLGQILRARGIQGGIILGGFNSNVLPESHAEIWAGFACVVAGVRTHRPTLSFCCVDHHELVVEAVQKTMELGYKRPALVIDQRIDRLVDGRLSSAMWLAQSGLPPETRVPAFMRGEAALKDPREFQAWFQQFRPDVLLTYYKQVKKWLGACGAWVPEDVGVVMLERLVSDQGWAGMDQRNDLAGEAAVDRVIGMIHNREIGPPEIPCATLVAAHWVHGDSVRKMAT